MEVIAALGRHGRLVLPAAPPPRLGMRAVLMSTRGPGTGQYFYGLSARAAVMKTCFIGCAEASSTRTRRVLRTTAAPIFSSFVRIVAVQALASSVPLSANRRRLIMSV